MSTLTSNENREIATELLEQIVAAADAGHALALGPQAVQNLRALLSDVLRVAVNTHETLTGCSECGAKWQLDHDQYCQSNRHRPGETGGGLAQKAEEQQS